MLTIKLLNKLLILFNKDALNGSKLRVKIFYIYQKKKGFK